MDWETSEDVWTGLAEGSRDPIVPIIQEVHKGFHRSGPTRSMEGIL